METMFFLFVLSIASWRITRWLRNNPEFKQALIKRIAGSTAR